MLGRGTAHGKPTENERTCEAGFPLTRCSTSRLPRVGGQESAREAIPRNRGAPPSVSRGGSDPGCAAVTGLLGLPCITLVLFENARRHGGGVSRVRAGLVDGWFVCEIQDRGPGLDDPLAGYLPPRPKRARGTGLWVARRLVRRLELLENEPGLTVRLWL